MNGFSDLHVTFDGSGPPSAERLGAPWRTVPVAVPGVWMGASGAAAGAAASAGGWQLWAIGEVFSYRRVRTDPLAAFVQDLRAGSGDPAQLDAHAVIFGWEEESRRLHVWTDRLGTSHAYVGTRPHHRAVGTCFAAVAADSGSGLDWAGVTGFCGFGFYPGDRTALENVRILRPATWSVFDAEGSAVSSRRYWDWWYAPEHDRSDDSFVDEFHEVWMRTVEAQCAPHRIVVPVSGGLDSRTLIGAAAPVGGPASTSVHAFTYGYTRRSAEISISRQVAARRGLVADERVVTPYLFDRIDEVAGAVEGFQALTLSRQVSVAEAIGTMGDRVVGGHWGDVWFDAGDPPNGASPSLVDVALRKFTKNGSAWLLGHLCAPQLDGVDPRGVLRDLVRDEAETLPNLGHPEMMLKALKTDQWSFRWTLASIRAYHLGLPTLLPFYANDVVDLFLRIPPERLVGRRLQVAYLRRYHPDLAGVRWQATGMSLWERPWEPGRALVRRAVTKVSRTVARRPPIQRNWEVQYLRAPGPARLRELILDQPPAILSALDREQTSRLLEDLVDAPDAGRGYSVDVLSTLAATVTPGGVRSPAS